MVDLIKFKIKNESLSENINVVTQCIVIQEWQQTASQTLVEYFASNFLSVPRTT